MDHKAWVQHLRPLDSDQRPEWATISQITIVPFYDRTGLIYETLGTLKTALTEEILVTIIVILVSVLHLRSSVLISALLPRRQQSGPNGGTAATSLRVRG